MTTRHTPGPWSIPHFVTADDPSAVERAKQQAKELDPLPGSGEPCRCGHVLCDAYEGAICTVHFEDEPRKSIEDGGGDDPPLAEAKANARLIASAPELLEACKDLLEDMKAHDRDADGFASVQKARAAIAAATGDTTLYFANGSTMTTDVPMTGGD